MSNPGEEYNSTLLGFAEVMVNRPQLYNASQLLEEEKNTNPSFFDEEAYLNPSSSGALWILSKSPLDATIDNLSLHQFTLYLIHVFREADSGWKNETGEVPEIFRRTIGTFDKILEKVHPVMNDRYKTVVELYNIVSLMQYIYMSFIPYDSQQHSCCSDVNRFAEKLLNIFDYYKPMIINKKFTELIHRRLIFFLNFIHCLSVLFRTSDDTNGRAEVTVGDFVKEVAIVTKCPLEFFSSFEFAVEPSEFCKVQLINCKKSVMIKSVKVFFTNILEPYIESKTHKKGTMTFGDCMQRIFQLNKLRSTINEEAFFKQIVNDLQQRFLERFNELRSRNESFTSDEIEHIIYIVISALIFMNKKDTAIDFMTVKEVLTIISFILNKLHQGEIIPVIDADTSDFLKKELDHLTFNFEKELKGIYYIYADLCWIYFIIFLSRGKYKKCTLTKFRKVLFKLSMDRFNFIKSPDDIQADRDKWIATLTRFESGEDFSRKFNEGECPVCILKTDNFAIFGCGHGVCFRCLDSMEETGTE